MSSARPPKSSVTLALVARAHGGLIRIEHARPHVIPLRAQRDRGTGAAGAVADAPVARLFSPCGEPMGPRHKAEGDGEDWERRARAPLLPHLAAPTR